MFTPEQKKGSVELLVLTMLDEEPRHGYDIGKRIELRSGGRLTFNPSTLYPVLYRMENQGWIKGVWVEKEGKRRRCYYHLTTDGKKILAEKVKGWQEFTDAVNEAIGLSNA